MKDVESHLIAHLKKINTAPFLFIGSGFSKRYLNLEDWAGLMKKFSNLMPYEFEYYSSTANKDWAEVAELMAKDFHPIWWKEQQFENNRKEFKDRISSKQSPLKVEIAKYLNSIEYKYGLDEKNDKEIAALKKIVIDGIITTNWDLLLEQIFEEQEMQVYIGQKELLFSHPLEINEIYKIHGCSSIPDSLVLTTSDYKGYNEKNAYLAAKLLTVFIEHPVIFLGYSISDDNIQQILKAITRCLDQDNIHKLKDRLIFVERAGQEEDSFENNSSLTIGKITVPITRVKTNDYEKIYNALAQNKRKFSMKMMRQMKSQIYELVKTNDPEEKIYVVDGEYDDTQDIEFVIGLGVKNVVEEMQSNHEISASKELSEHGYGGISDIELFNELLSDEPKYDYDSIVKISLPQILRSNQYVPLFRYVLESSVEDELLDSKIKNKLKMRYTDFLTETQKKNIKNLSWDWQFKNLDEVLKGFPDIKVAIEQIPLLGQKNLNCDDLKDFLIKNSKFVKEKNTPEGTGIRRLFRIYDWLKYGQSKDLRKRLGK
ncbi:TPA: SIR2 family NAD-dependent protein deacylase [Bacillus anthracis]|uniref:SIR2 family NAD-dependent protein deacylase n=5 Tax=Bacillus anthracis TaxID=1392 RepID=UPI00330E4D86|nr:SIR2 family protein [Bacillus cereus biovar anthracis]HDR6234910.1 SIR2 family protein [Bacillus cereus biovar anthracis]HDR6240743.1 SIR2 family protein [Bacillus cereus biovar anthracis]HDR6252594.1 SIR2 family protein [Bacillus cereus biovar anthracis]